MESSRERASPLQPVIRAIALKSSLTETGFPSILKSDSEDSEATTSGGNDARPCRRLFAMLRLKYIIDFFRIFLVNVLF